MESDSVKRNDDSLQSSTPESLSGLPPLCAPRFTTLKDLVDPVTFELCVQEEAPRAKPKGLFSSLLQDHVELLAGDVVDHRDRYAPDAVKLVEDLLQRRKDVKTLEEQDRELLDRATLDFATFVPPKDPPAARKPAPKRVKQEPEEGVIHLVDTPPEAEMPAYWWLR